MAGPLKTIALLGATGSIGGSTLDVVARHPGRFRIGALSAHSRVDELLALCARFRPDSAVVTDPQGYAALRDGLRHIQQCSAERHLDCPNFQRILRITLNKGAKG